MNIAYNATAASINTITLYCGGNPADNTQDIIYTSVSCDTVQTTEDVTLAAGETFMCRYKTSPLAYHKYTCELTYSLGSGGEHYNLSQTSFEQNCTPGTFDYAGKCVYCAVATGSQDSTSDAGATDVTDCYIPTTTQFSDDTGTYMYASNCYYDGEYNGTEASSSTTS